LAVRIIALIEKLALMRSHFASGDRMAADLRRLGAQVEVRAENHTLYVVADKPAA
jgi:hypothetical protein